MWKRLEPIQQDSLPLYIVFTLNDGYEINITDYIHIWAVNITKTDFLLYLKDSNEGLHLENDNLYIEKGVQMLSNPEKLRRVLIKKEDDGKDLHVTMTMSFGYSFRLKFKLTEQSREYYFHKVTQPLLKSIQDLHSSQNKLRKLLNGKDRELDYYKREGGAIAIEHYTTPQYNDTAHMSEHKVYEENFDAPNQFTNFNDLIKKLGAPKLTTNIKPEDSSQRMIKQEPSAVKKEPIRNGVIKIELNANNSIKRESETEIPSVIQNRTVTDNNDIKQELIKTEPLALTPKKKLKKKLNY